jgi:hypothetical protein
MQKYIFFFLFFLFLQTTVVRAEVKLLKQEEILKLTNYALTIQNLQLQIEITTQTIQRLDDERSTYINDLFKRYGYNPKEWVINLDKGVWVRKKASESEKAGDEKNKDK